MPVLMTFLNDPFAWTRPEDFGNWPSLMRAKKLWGTGRGVKGNEGREEENKERKKEKERRKHR